MFVEFVVVDAKLGLGQAESIRQDRLDCQIVSLQASTTFSVHVAFLWAQRNIKITKVYQLLFFIHSIF